MDEYLGGGLGCGCQQPPGRSPQGTRCRRPPAGTNVHLQLPGHWAVRAPGRPRSAIRQGRGQLRAALAHPIGILLLHTVPTHRDAVHRDRPPASPSGRQGLARAKEASLAARASRIRPRGIWSRKPSRSLRPLTTVVRERRARPRWCADGSGRRGTDPVSQGRLPVFDRKATVFLSGFP